MFPHLLTVKSHRRPTIPSACTPTQNTVKTVKSPFYPNPKHKPCSPSNKSSSNCKHSGQTKAAPSSNLSTWKSAPVLPTPPPACARSVPSLGLPPTSNPAAAPKTAATATIPTAYNTITNSKSPSNPLPPISKTSISIPCANWASTPKSTTSVSLKTTGKTPPSVHGAWAGKSGSTAWK